MSLLLAASLLDELSASKHMPVSLSSSLLLLPPSLPLLGPGLVGLGRMRSLSLSLPLAGLVLPSEALSSDGVCQSSLPSSLSLLLAAACRFCLLFLPQYCRGSGGVRHSRLLAARAPLHAAALVARLAQRHLHLGPAC